MTYPVATREEVEFFAAHGYLVVRDAIDEGELASLEEQCDKILSDPHRFAFDWAWERGVRREDRPFRIVQGSPTGAWPGIAETVFRRWIVEFGSTLLARDVEFWYDQLLAKPPGASEIGRAHV